MGLITGFIQKASRCPTPHPERERVSQAALRTRLLPATVRAAVNATLARAPPQALQLAVLGPPTSAQAVDGAIITVLSKQVRR